MNIDTFVNQETDLLRAFKEFWTSQKDYPQELDAGDWDEQFCSFCAIREPIPGVDLTRYIGQDARCLIPEAPTTPILG